MAYIPRFPVTIADGDDEALGATTDPEVSNGDGSVIAILKHVRTVLRSTRSLLASGLMKIGQQLPAHLIGGRLDVSLGAAPANVTVTVGAGNVGLDGVVSAGNSSTVLLGAAGVFTGEFEDVSNYGTITVTSFSNQRTLTVDGVHLQFSSDGVNVDEDQIAPAVPSTLLKLKLMVTNQYFRVVYKNHETNPQAVFRLQTIYHPARPLDALAPVQGLVFINNAQRLVEIAQINTAAVGPTAIISAFGGRRTRVLALLLTCSTNASITLKSGSSTTVLPRQDLQPRFPFAVNFAPYAFLALGNEGQDINLTQTSPPANLTGIVIYARV